MFPWVLREQRFRSELLGLGGSARKALGEGRWQAFGIVFGSECSFAQHDRAPGAEEAQLPHAGRRE